MNTNKKWASKALQEVWDMKEAVYQDIKHMTFEQKKKYYAEGLKKACHELGTKLIKNNDGTLSMVRN